MFLDTHAIMIKRFLILVGLIFCSFSTGALAGEPLPWQTNFQPAASPVAVQMHQFHDFLLWIIFGIALFVLLLLIYVILRFNKRANPEPQKFSHNVLIEVLWTVIPVIILIVIAVPSFKLLYYGDRAVEPEMTLKITGYQWYWGYEYPDHEGINFMSYMVPDDDINARAGQKRLLSTDNVVVLPVDTDIQILVTAADVLHSWAIPAFGVKIDAVPGRLNETWVHITEPGTYYGQCSELCGKDHAYMPIEIRAVSRKEFNRWVTDAAKEFSQDTTNATQYAYFEEQ